MKKKILITIIALVLAIACAFVGLFVVVLVKEKSTRLSVNTYVEPASALPDYEYEKKWWPNVIPMLFGYRETSTESDGSETTQDYCIIQPLVYDCKDFASFEMLIKYNPEVLQFGKYPNAYIPPEDSVESIIVTEEAPGRVRLVGLHPIWEANGRQRFDMISFLMIGEGHHGIETQLISCKNTNGEDIRCESYLYGGLDLVPEFAPDTQNDAIIRVEVSKPTYYTSEKDRNERSGMSMTVHVEPFEKEFIDCELKITYNPDELQYVEFVGGYTEGITTHATDLVTPEPGVLLLRVRNRIGTSTDPLLFQVFTKDEIDFDVQLLSYTDEGDVRENAQLVVDRPETVPEVVNLSELMFKSMVSELGSEIKKGIGKLFKSE